MNWTYAVSGWMFALISAIFCLTLMLHTVAFGKKALESGPSFLTSVGILGTFLGIAFGLLHFDTTDFNNSIPKLLDGLKTAFWSSIAGLVGALSLKIRQFLTKEDSENSLESMLTGAHHALQITAKALDLEASDGYANILRKHHQETRKILHALEDRIQDFENHLVEMNTSALTEAIQSIISEFNLKITEQYGDNFRQLNESVGLMVSWQSDYKDQISTLINDQQRVASSMRQATEAYSTMVEHAKSFSGISETLGDLLKVLNEERGDLDEHLLRLGELVNSATSGLPKLEERIYFLTDGLAESIRTHQQNMQQLLEHSSKSFGTTLSQVSEDLYHAVERNQQVVGEQITTLLNRHEKQMMYLDDALEQELNKSLKTLGMQLSALSEKFVTDYTPLTERLRDLLRNVDAVHYDKSKWVAERE